MSQKNPFLRFSRLFQVVFRTFQCLRMLLAIKSPKSVDGITQARAIKLQWAHQMLKICNFQISIEPHSAPLCQTPCLYVSNHVGYMDIPVMMSIAPVSFIAKKEIRKWPVFGAGAAAAETVFVDRKSGASRKLVVEHLATAISKEGKSIVLFPEGTSSPFGKPWKRGAFHIAKDCDFEVQAFRIAYRYHRKIAYWGNDTFLFHLWRMLGLGAVEVSVEIFPSQKIQNIDLDKNALQNSVTQSLKNKLEGWGQDFEVNDLFEIQPDS